LSLRSSVISRSSFLRGLIIGADSVSPTPINKHGAKTSLVRLKPELPEVSVLTMNCLASSAAQFGSQRRREPLPDS